MPAWADAMEVARTPAPAQAWRAELARRLRSACDASFAAVMTCAPGDWMRLRHDSDPQGLGHLVDRIQQEFLPRIERAGEGWQSAMPRFGPVYMPLETARDQGLAGELREAVLQPADIDGWVTAFLVAGEPQRLLGIVALGAGDSSARLLARCGRPLLELSRHASATLASALALAEGCFAEPGDPAALGELTLRERQIATLAAQGYSNVNVSARLGISEQTVAVHLRSIYRKLAVHSRVELASLVT